MLTWKEIVRLRALMTSDIDSSGDILG